MSEEPTRRSTRARKAVVPFTIEIDEEEERRVREEERLWERGLVEDHDNDYYVKEETTIECTNDCTKNVESQDCKHTTLPDAICICECHEVDCGCDETCDLDECECDCHDDDEELEGFLADSDEEEEEEEEIEEEEEEESEITTDEEEESDDFSGETDDECDCTVNVPAYKCKFTKKSDDGSPCVCDCHEDDEDNFDEEPEAKRQRAEE